MEPKFKLIYQPKKQGYDITNKHKLDVYNITMIKNIFNVCIQG